MSSEGTKMQIGVIGLGRVGANISRRLLQAGHSCVVWDANAATGQEPNHEGAQGVASLQQVVQALKDKPRAVWVMLPAGRITEQTINQPAELMDPGDLVIEGGNAYCKDDVRRAKTASLFARFRSRQEHTFAGKVLPAMRFGFGGYVELAAPKA
jgi:6-phosphogluconate dehydrogenase